MEWPTARSLNPFAFQQAKHATKSASNFTSIRASNSALTSAQATTDLPDSRARAPRREQQREVSCTNGTIAVDVGCS
jgi:hypothetical protein